MWRTIQRTVVEDKTDNPHTRIQRTRSWIFKAYVNLGYLRNMSFLTIKILMTIAGYTSLIQLLTAKWLVSQVAGRSVACVCLKMSYSLSNVDAKLCVTEFALSISDLTWNSCWQKHSLKSRLLDLGIHLWPCMSSLSSGEQRHLSSFPEIRRCMMHFWRAIKYNDMWTNPF